MPAGPVQQDQVGPRPGLQHPGAHPADVDVAERVIDVAELAPDADVRGQSRCVIRCPFRTGRGPPRASPARRSAAVRRPSRPSSREFSMVRNSTGCVGGVVVVPVPGPRRRVDEVAGRPGRGLVLDLAVPVAGDHVVHGLVVVALHVGAEAGRDRLPEDLEGGGRQPPGDRQRRRVVHLAGRQRLELGRVHHHRPRDHRPDRVGKPAEEVGQAEVWSRLRHQIVSVRPPSAVGQVLPALGREPRRV